MDSLELEREEERRRRKNETSLMYYSGDEDDEDDSSVTSSTGGGGGVVLGHGVGRGSHQHRHSHSSSFKSRSSARGSTESPPTTTASGTGVHLYVTPPTVCWSPSDGRTDTVISGPQLRITPPSRRQSTASSVLDPGYFSFPASRRQSSVSPPLICSQHFEEADQTRLSVPPAASGRRGSRHKFPLASPCSPSNRSSSPPSSEYSLSSPALYQQRHPRRTSSQPSIDPGYFSTPASRRTSAISPTPIARRQSVALSPTSGEPPTSPTRLIAYSPSRYYRPVSPTIKEAQQFSTTSSTQPTSRRPQPDKGYHSTPSSRRASYLTTNAAEHGYPKSHSQPATRRSSLAPQSLQSDDLLLPFSTPSSRRPSQHSPSMLDVTQRDPPRTSLRLSPSLFTTDEQFLSPSSADCGYHSTPITRRPSAVSPTNTQPQHYSTPSTRRQSFLPPSSLHIPSEKSHLRRPSAPAILCKQESKKKLLFPSSPSPEPGNRQHFFYPQAHKEVTIPTVVVHQQPDGTSWSQGGFIGRPVRRGSITSSPQPRRQRRQSEPFVEEVQSFRLRTNSAHIPSSPLASASGTVSAIHRSPIRSKTQTSRPRLRSLSSVTEVRTRTNQPLISPAAMLLDNTSSYNIREVEITIPRDRKLGLSIRGGAEYDMGIYISYIDRGSVAEDVGLSVGDQIVRVNDVSFLDVPHDEAVDVLKHHNRMTFVVRQQEQSRMTSSLSHYVGQWVASCGEVTTTTVQPPPKIKISPSPSMSFKNSRKQRKSESDVHASREQTTASSGYGQARTPTCHAAELQIIDAKARTLLKGSAYNKLLYYREEYDKRNMTIDAFIAVIMELLDTPEQYTLLSDIRKIVSVDHLDKFDELVYRREEQVMRNKVTKQLAAENILKPVPVNPRVPRSPHTRAHFRLSHERLCRDPPEGDEGLTGSEDSGVDLTANGGGGAVGRSTTLPCSSRQAYMASGQHGMEVPRSPKPVRSRRGVESSVPTPAPSTRPKTANRKEQESAPSEMAVATAGYSSTADVTSQKELGRQADFNRRQWDTLTASFDVALDRRSPSRQVQRRRSSEELLLQQRNSSSYSQDSRDGCDSDDAREGSSGNSHVWRRHHSLQEGSSFIQRPRPRTRFSQLSPEEGKTRKFRVKVPKCKSTLGMVVEGGANTSHPLPRIISILETGCAYQCRSLKVGHIIMEVDGVKLDGMTHSQAASIISHAFTSKERNHIELHVAEKRKTPLEMRRSSHVPQQ